MKVKKTEYDAATGEYKEVYEEDNPILPEPETPPEKSLEEKVQELQNNVLNLQSVLINQKISGGGIELTDSSALPVKDFAMQGKTEQESTTGAQLFDIDSFLQQDAEDVMTFGKGRQLIMTLKPNTQYTMSTDNVGNTSSATPEKDRSLYFTTVDDVILNGVSTAVVKGTPITVTSDGSGHVKIILFDRENATPIIKKEKYVMLNEGSAATAYETYTGGKPSPSVEYPQEIVSAGNRIEETEKYEVQIKINGDNLFDKRLLTGGEFIWKNGIETYRYWDNGKNFTYHGIFEENKQYTFTLRYLRDDNAVQYITAIRFYYTDGTYEQFNDIKHNAIVSLTSKIGKTIDRITGNWNNERAVYIDLSTTRLNAGIKDMGFQLYQEQIVTLALDRQLTKWDRLEQREGIWGIAYQTGHIQSYNGESITTEYVSTTGGLDDGAEIYYKLPEQEFVQLFEETQTALNTLHTFYPTTVITNSDDCEMEVEYICDTKNYVDKQIQEVVTKQIDTDKLILERTM